MFFIKIIMGTKRMHNNRVFKMHTKKAGGGEFTKKLGQIRNAIFGKKKQHSNFTQEVTLFGNPLYEGPGKVEGDKKWLNTKKSGTGKNNVRENDYNEIYAFPKGEPYAQVLPNEHRGQPSLPPRKQTKKAPNTELTNKMFDAQLRGHKENKKEIYATVAETGEYEPSRPPSPPPRKKQQHTNSKGRQISMLPPPLPPPRRQHTQAPIVYASLDFSESKNIRTDPNKKRTGPSKQKKNGVVYATLRDIM